MTPADEEMEEALNPMRHYPNRSLAGFRGESMVTMCGKEIALSVHFSRWSNYHVQDNPYMLVCAQCIEATTPHSTSSTHNA